MKKQQKERVKVKTKEEFAKAIKNGEEYIEIVGKYKDMAFKIKATGNILGEFV